MSDLKQVRMLLAAAGRDIAALRGMGDAAVFADEIFGFHTQQAAEKLLKAWIASLGETYPLSHDLASLLDMIKTRDADIARFDELVDYTRYAVRLRYASAAPGTRPLDRTKLSGRWKPCSRRSGGGWWKRRGAATVDTNVTAPALEKLMNYAPSHDVQ